MKWRKVSCLLSLFSLTLVSHFPFLKSAWISVITNDQIIYRYNLESSLQILKLGTWLLLWIHVKRMLKMKIAVQEYFNTAFNVFLSDVLKTCADIDIGLKEAYIIVFWNPYSPRLKAIAWFHANVFSIIALFCFIFNRLCYYKMCWSIKWQSCSLFLWHLICCKNVKKLKWPY